MLTPMPVDIQVCWFEALDGQFVQLQFVTGLSYMQIACKNVVIHRTKVCIYTHAETVSSPVYIMKDAAALAC